MLYETKPLPDIYEGYSENYITVRTESKRNLINEIRCVKVAHRVGEYLFAKGEEL